jgi:hypothetical protein
VENDVAIVSSLGKSGEILASPWGMVVVKLDGDETLLIIRSGHIFLREKPTIVVSSATSVAIQTP